MELENPKDFSIVAITWVDSATAGDGGWHKIDLENLKEDPLECYTVGFVIAENDDRIVICSSYFENTIENEIGTVGAISIPLTAVIGTEWIYKPKDHNLDIETEDKGD